MSQRKLHSLGEALLSTGLGFGIAYAVNYLTIEYLAREFTKAQGALVLTLILTVASIIRQYCTRRLFNSWHHKPAGK